MTTVIVRRIESRLEAMTQPGDAGLKASEALRAAADNLRSIEQICLEELDVQLKPILAFLDRGPRRPSNDELQALMRAADSALTACGALDKPLLGRALLMLCAMADALSQTDYWPDRALDPAIQLVALSRARSLPDEDAGALLDNLNLCLGQYLQHAGEA